ncbi:hypothetical protein [Clostridium fallax]|uniref:Uncharacterized protein n=1 Tax=Clostridium fallax TaxID=1533 RepID=A0A1M4UYD5_9CLOT|nr:hypothetical protein [Clostridium fallax]SHE61682.1 hypothetical protein SAMN05443638_10657 [Clostridium fallax]SQB06726.1 Uncharacterised protein [Clostridium fallax]
MSYLDLLIKRAAIKAAEKINEELKARKKYLKKCRNREILYKKKLSLGRRL